MSEIIGDLQEDPGAIIIAVIMIFVLILWLSQSSSFNPIGQNSTFTAKYSTTYTNTKWFLTLILPLALAVFVNGMRHTLDRTEPEEGTEE